MNENERVCPFSISASAGSFVMCLREKCQAWDDLSGFCLMMREPSPVLITNDGVVSYTSTYVYERGRGVV